MNAAWIFGGQIIVSVENPYETPLQHAVYRGNVEIVKCYLTLEGV